jgi:1-acyl-sn-glycerol-3-phosphate acyltransferase
MKIAAHSIKTILAVWFSIGFLCSFLILYPLFLLTLSHPSLYGTAHKLRRLWAWILFIWNGIRVKQIFEAPLSHKHAYVITPNHTSQLDIVTLTGMLMLDFNFMAKDELAKIPLFGIFFRTIDIAVDRKNARKAALAYQKANNQLIKGKSIVIYPEGTISKVAPKLGNFKDGAFRLAIENQVDVLPITIMGNWKRLPAKSKFYFTPGRVIHYIHKPISTKGMTVDQTSELSATVKRKIEQTLDQYARGLLK